ncbi:MAG: DUF2312 domain-containing protein [Pseudomonadota bacterium]
MNASNGDMMIDQATAQRLRNLIERIEHLEQEKQNLAEDIRELYGEAKSEGFIPSVLRKCVAVRRQDPVKRSEEVAILETYLAALGVE